jgi:adenylate kinase family enzyme
VKKVAVFGNTGAGKSTLARKLAAVTGLPLYPLDLIQWRVGGAPVPHEEYLRAHAELLGREAWIIDGYGDRDSAWERFSAADTLVYLDLPLITHFAWVTKRFIAWGLAGKLPEGYPEGSPLLASAVSNYRTAWRCHRWLTPQYRRLVAEERHRKQVHHLRSPAEIAAFLAAVQMERPGQEGAA